MAKLITFPKQNLSAPFFESGMILSEQAEGYEVMMAGSLVMAKVCASCLMKPSIGDEVVLVVLKNKVLILAISETQAKKSTLQLGENVAIQAGKLNIESHTIHLETEQYCLEAESSIEHLSQLKSMDAPVIREQAKCVIIKADQIALG